MKIMSGRAIALENTLHTLNQYGISAWHVGAPCSGDDIGIYYFIPLLAHLFNINAAYATNLFWVIVLAVSSLVGFLSICALYKNWLVKIISLYCFYYMARWAHHIGDLYIAAAAITMALIPLSLYLINKQQRFWIKALAIFLCGITIGIFHFIRSYSEFPVLFFILFILIFNKNIIKRLKISLIGLLAVGVLIPVLCFKTLIHRDIVYFNNPAMSYLNHHPFWHPVYLGLGYLPNPYGIRWDDSVAAAKVESIQNNTPAESPLYESILRDQVILIAEKDPLFIVQTILAKASALFDHVKPYLIIALILSILFPKGWRIELAFWSLLLLSALPGLLVIPEALYVLGLISGAMIYMLISIGHALDCFLYPPKTQKYKYNIVISFFVSQVNRLLTMQNEISTLLCLLISRLAHFLTLLVTKKQNNNGEL